MRFVETEILRGWKDICAYLGGMSERKARELLETGGLPVVIAAGRPMTTKRMLSRWVEKSCQAKS